MISEMKLCFSDNNECMQFLNSACSSQVEETLVLFKTSIIIKILIASYNCFKQFDVIIMKYGTDIASIPRVAS